MNNTQFQLAKAILSTWNRPFVAGSWTEVRCVHCNGYIEIFKKDWPRDWTQPKINVLLRRCLFHKEDCIVLEAEKITRGNKR